MTLVKSQVSDNLLWNSLFLTLYISIFFLFPPSFFSELFCVINGGTDTNT